MISEDFMLCKSENRDPAHCLAEGRKVTRCATELWVNLCGFRAEIRINKMRESCLAEWDTHWNCLEKNNQVRKTKKTS